MRSLLAALVVIAGLAAAAPAAAAQCPNAAAATVPGAERQERACPRRSHHRGHADQRAHGPQRLGGPERVGHQEPDRRARAADRRLLPRHSTTNGTHGWNHDSQFVIRLPDDWNGKLVITGAPGVRKQYASDFVIGDYVLGKGYAYASTDKGNTGTSFYADGAEPGDAIAEWNRRVTELAAGQGDRRAPLRPRVGAHVRDRHLQRRLPDALAAREPARPLRRRRRLGGHAVRLHAGAEPALVPATGPEALPALPGDGDQAAHDAISPPGSRPARSSSGTTTTPSTGTSRSAPTARSSTRAGTARRRRARRSARPARRTATPTTTMRRGRRPCGRPSRGRQHGPDRQAAADAARHARHAAADPRRLRRYGTRSPPRAPARCTATT